MTTDNLPIPPGSWNSVFFADMIVGADGDPKRLKRLSAPEPFKTLQEAVDWIEANVKAEPYPLSGIVTYLDADGEWQTAWEW